MNLGSYSDETGNYELSVSNGYAVALRDTGEYHIGKLTTKSNLPYAKKYKEVAKRYNRELNKNKAKTA